MPVLRLRQAVSGLPLHGVEPTRLPPANAAAQAACEDAAALEPGAERDAALRRAAADHPAHLAAWAALAEEALDAGQPVDAYAFARVGYHRGLDAVRRAGWRGHGPVPWSHEANRGFLRCLDALRRAAGAIGERDEEERCRTFLRDLDGAPPATT